MSKKVNKIETTTATGETIRELMEKYPNVSLRRICAHTLELHKADPINQTINYGILLKKSKEPVVGQMYDPEAINWAAVEQKLIEKGYTPDDYFGFDWEELNAASTRGHAATLSKNMDDFNVGGKVYLRRNATVPYEIVYKTDTHIVLMLEGSSEPMAWAHNTFLLNGPTFEPRASKVIDEAEA